MSFQVTGWLVWPTLALIFLGAVKVAELIF